MNRRKFMFAGLGAGALLAGTAAWMRPADRGGPYDDYFRALNRELKANGPMCPVLLIDLDRLDHNIDVVMRSVRRGGKHLRLVEKSLPSPGLLAYIARRAGTRRLMSFHQPFLNHDAVAFADADILLGKPLPVRSAELFYREHKGAFDPARQLQWLIDTPQRLRQYLALAQGLGTRMRVNIELDVGLHRGGVADQAALGELLALIAAHPQYLEFAGFMGYDPFVGMGVPGILGSPEAVRQGHGALPGTCRLRPPALRRAVDTTADPEYRRQPQLSHAREGNAEQRGLGGHRHAQAEPLRPGVPGRACAGRLHRHAGTQEHRRGADPGAGRQVPAVFLVGPQPARHLLHLRRQLDGRLRLARGTAQQRHLRAQPNQEMVNGSPSVGLEVDDQVFLRPTQSESVLLQFGDLLALRGGRIVERWPVYA